MRRKFTLKSWSIKTFLILFIALIVVIPNIFVFLIIDQNVSAASQNSLNDSAANSVHLLDQNINQLANNNNYMVNKLSKQLSGDFGNKNKYQTLLSNVENSSNTVDALTLGNQKGQFLRSPEVKSIGDVRKELWYKLAMDHPGQIVITPQFISTLTKKNTIIIAKTTPDRQAVISMDINLDAINKVVNKAVVGDHGYAFILDKNGEWIVNKRAKTGGDASRLIQSKTSKSLQGHFNDKDNGTRVFYIKNARTGWTIGGVMSMQEVDQTIHPIITKIGLVIFIFLLLSLVIAAFFITRLFVRPMIKIAQTFSKVSKGDLTQTLGKDTSGNKEFALLTASTNHMIESLKNIVDAINKKSEILAVSSEELTASTEENKAASDQIAASIQEIAVGASSQSETIEKVSKHAAAINDDASTILKRTQSLSETAGKESEAIHEGTQSLGHITGQMNAIQDTSNQTVASLTELQEHVKAIKKMNELINGIADQTHLLSLNAAIEAARAGESGQGFAVVSDEIRKLAQQSKESSKQITDVVATITASTTGVVQLMENNAEQINQGITVVHQAGESFKKIQDAVQMAHEDIKNVTNSVDRISADTHSVADSFTNITKLANTASKNSEDVSAAAEEQSASMEEVANSATALATAADELHQIVDVFKLNEK